MAGTYPTNPCFAAINFRSRRSAARSRSVSLRRQTRNLGGHLWEFTCRYDLMNRTDFGPIDGFLEEQQGGQEAFQIVLPVISEHSGSVTGTPLVNGAHAIGATSINIDGFSGTFPPGDYVKFDDNKVYKITKERVGPGALSISPPLRRALNDNEVVVFNDVPFTVVQANDVQEYDLAPAMKYQFEVDLVEDI